MNRPWYSSTDNMGIVIAIEIETGVAIATGIPTLIPIPISSMVHPNRPGYLADAVR